MRGARNPELDGAHRWCVGMALASAAVIHAGAGLRHRDRVLVLAFFAGAAVLQAVLGWLALNRWSPAVSAAVIASGAGLIALWILTRTTGLPSWTGHPAVEPVGLPDTVASFLEASAALFARFLEYGRVEATSRWGARVIPAFAAMTLAALVAPLPHDGGPAMRMSRAPMPRLEAEIAAAENVVTTPEPAPLVPGRAPRTREPSLRVRAPATSEVGPQITPTPAPVEVVRTPPRPSPARPGVDRGPRSILRKVIRLGARR